MKTQRFYARAVQLTTIWATIVLVGACQPDNQASDANDRSYVLLPPEVASQIPDERLRDYIATLAEVASSDGSGGDAIGRLAMAYDANGFDLAAETMYRVATHRDPEAFKWQYLLAIRQQKNGDLEGAIASATHAIETDRAYPAVYVRLGNWLLDSGEAAAARVAFEQAVDLGAGPAAELGTARTLIKTGDYAAALEVLTSVVSDTNHPVAFRLLSDAWRAIGDEAKARDYLQFASQAKSMWFNDPLVSEMRTHARAKNTRLHDIELMLGSGLVDEALDALQAFDIEERTDFNVQYHFALAYFQNQMFDVAREHLLQAIELEPVHYPSHLLLASLYQRYENNIKAAEHLEHVVKIYPKLQIAHQELGFVRLRIGETKGALESFKTAINLDSTAPNVHYYAGVILGADGRCDLAMRYFETAIALDENHDKARMGISECLRATSASSISSKPTPIESTSPADGSVD